MTKPETDQATPRPAYWHCSWVGKQLDKRQVCCYLRGVGIRLLLVFYRGEKTRLPGKGFNNVPKGLRSGTPASRHCFFSHKHLREIYAFMEKAKAVELAS